jgi:hypothetical protein
MKSSVEELLSIADRGTKTRTEALAGFRDYVSRRWRGRFDGVTPFDADILESNLRNEWLAFHMPNLTDEETEELIQCTRAPRVKLVHAQELDAMTKYVMRINRLRELEDAGEPLPPARQAPQLRLVQTDAARDRK